MASKKKTAAKKRPPSILFLFGDADRLRADGLRLEVPSLVAMGLTLASAAKADHAEVTSTDSLHAFFDDRVARRQTFDVLVVVAHGNEHGVRLTHDTFHSWDAFADLVKAVKPRRMVLVSCDGGRWPAANLLFRRLPELRRIYASPMAASRNLGGLMLALAPYLLNNKRPSKDDVFLAQAAGLLLGGGQIRQWMRTKDKDNAASVLYDAGAGLLHRLIRP